MVTKLPKFYGIDIGKSTTKVVVVEYLAKGKDEPATPVLKKLFSFQTGNGNLTSEDPGMRLDLAVRIKDAIAGAKLDTKRCVVALPEPTVFNRLLTFPEMEEKKLSEAIHWNAAQFIPIPVNEVQMDWLKTAEVVVENQKMLQLLLVAAPKKLINQVAEIFKQADQELIAIETEAVATSRVIANAYPGAPSMLVLDIGSAGTDLSVISAGNLIFSQSLGTGSDAMTKAIASGFGLDPTQAEQYKIKFGLMEGQADGKIAAALQPVTNIILTETIKTINFFRSKYQQSTPQKILLVGDGSRVPGLAEYMAAKIGIPVELANLQQNLAIDPAAEAEVQTRGLSSYAVALGLAMKQQ